MDFKALMNSSEYDFLRINEHLKDRIAITEEYTSAHSRSEPGVQSYQ